MTAQIIAASEIARRREEREKRRKGREVWIGSILEPAESEKKPVGGVALDLKETKL